MKKIINGKMYNTETAKVLGEYDNGYVCGDFNYFSETLYRKKTGEYFLFGAGGALSGYASHCGNRSGYGKEIIPMSEAKAKKWAEEYLDADEYIAVFGEPEE